MNHKIAIYGLGGNDEIRVASTEVSNPVYFDGGGGADTLVGNATNGTLVGEAGDDSIEGGAGHDSITGGGGNDILIGNLLARLPLAQGGGEVVQVVDRFLGGASGELRLGWTGGNDSMYGEGGNDAFYAKDSVYDLLVGGSATGDEIMNWDSTIDDDLEIEVYP